MNITRGVQFHMTGLPDAAVKESYDRIQSATQQEEPQWVELELEFEPWPDI